MRKAFSGIALALCLLFLFSGCSVLSSFGNVNDLLRAPAMGQTQGDVQKALAAHLNADPLYKYPREGSHLSPLLLVDLNGDGIDECVVFYSLPEAETGSTVLIAMLEQQDGTWHVRYELDGGNTDVASVAVADMFGDGTKQLVVGYSSATLGSKSLRLYDYKNNVFTPTLIDGYYDHYLLDDFTGLGQQELVVVTQDTGLRLDFITGQNGSFEYLQENSVPLYENFETCINIQTSVVEGERYLVVDGMWGQPVLVASQILVYASTGRFYSRESDTALITAINDTARTSTVLVSRDLDGDGEVEIPVQVNDDAEDPAIEEGLQVKLIDWMDPIREEPESRFFGLFDEYHGLFVSLPQAWRDTVYIRAGSSAGSWQVVKQGYSQPALELLDNTDGGTLPDGARRLIGTQNSYLLLGNITAAEQEAIQYLLLT